MPIIKTLTIITTAPDQTLGDVSGAFNIIESIYAANNSYFKINVNWIIKVTDISKPQDVETYSDFFNMAKLLGVNLHPIYLRPENTDSLNDNIKDLLATTDLFICFPVYSSFREISLIFKHNKPVLLFSEYDELSLFVKLGLIVQDNSAIDQAQLGIYFSNHVLYFSYLNKMRANNDLVNKKTFCLISLLLQSRKNPKINVDIIVRLDGLQLNNSTSSLSDKFVSSELALIRPCYSQIQIIDRHGTTIEKMTINEDDSLPVVRLIDPFPLTAKGFKFLLSIAQPFAGLTGDQSLSEGITNNNIILYQAMPWKCVLFDEFMKLCKEHLGEDSKLLDFFAMIRKDKTQDINHKYLIKISDIIYANEAGLLDEIQKIKKIILEKFNLRKNVISRLRTAICKPNEIRELFNPFALLAKGITMLDSNTVHDTASQPLFASQISSMEIQSIRETYDSEIANEDKEETYRKKLKHTPNI